MTGRMLRLGRDIRGITAVEFALIAPVFLLFVLGIIEFGLVQYASATLEGATMQSARMGKTGYTDDGISREDYIISVVEDRASGLLDPALLSIDTQTYGQFDHIHEPEPITNDVNGNGIYDAGDAYEDINGNAQWDADMGAAGLGGAGDIVVYTVTYEWPLMTPLISSVIGQDSIPLSSSVVVRNEPWETFNLGF